MENSVSVNNNMKNPKLNMGEIIPPNSFNKPVLYSHVKATRDFNILNHDIYESQKRAKSLNDRKTPKSVFVALSAIGLTCCFPLIKKLIKH